MCSSNEKLADETQAILIVGSGFDENVLEVESDIEFGRKHFVERYEQLGGSGINYTMRLANFGHAILPILPLGRDVVGYKVQKTVYEMMIKNSINNEAIQFIEKEEEFLCDKIKTSQSTIVVSKKKHTTFTERLHGIEHYRGFVKKRLSDLENFEQLSLSAVMIGHVFADDPNLNAGDITKEIINQYQNKALVFTNFGESQIKLGSSFWKDIIRGVTIFQLSLSEARIFFKNGNQPVSLIKIIEWFRKNNITAVLTLDRFGSVATFKDGKDGVIFCWPFELDNIVDTIGAGDAFGAGIVASLYQKYSFDFNDFLGAIKEARVWAAYACTTIGGASDCPNRLTLKKFEAGIKKQEFYPVTIKSWKEAKLMLKLIDNSY